MRFIKLHECIHEYVTAARYEVKKTPIYLNPYKLVSLKERPEGDGTYVTTEDSRTYFVDEIPDEIILICKAMIKENNYA